MSAAKPRKKESCAEAFSARAGTRGARKDRVERAEGLCRTRETTAANTSQTETVAGWKCKLIDFEDSAMKPAGADP